MVEKVENNNDFKQMIKELRIATEKSVEKLKNLEVSGTEDAANAALWVVSGIWNGKEYGEIDSALREKGHKSSMEETLEKMGVAQEQVR